MISDIFTAVGQAVTGFSGVLASGISSVTSMFYDTSGTTPQLTVLGTLLLIAVGVGIVYFAFRLIKGLVRRA